MIGFGHPLPAVVTVHGEVTAAKAGELYVGIVAQIIQKCLHIGLCRLWTDIAAIEETVDQNRHTGPGNDFGECRDMALMGVDTAGGQQAEQVQLAAGILQFGND